MVRVLNKTKTDLVLISETIVALMNKSSKRKVAFESNGFKANFGKVS